MEPDAAPAVRLPDISTTGWTHHRTWEREREDLRIAQREGVRPLRHEYRYIWRDEALWEWPKAQTQTSTHKLFSPPFSPPTRSFIHAAGFPIGGGDFWINPDSATTQVHWTVVYRLSDLQQIRCSSGTAVHSNQQSHIWRIMTVQKNEEDSHSVFNEAAQLKHGERPTPKNSNAHVML